MNAFQNQLVMNDGRTLRDYAVDGLPDDCAYVQSLDQQLPPQAVSIAEFEQCMRGGSK